MEYHLKLPLTKQQIDKLHIGDILYVTGTFFTARDEAHHKMLSLPRDQTSFDTSKMALFHCGPLMKKIDNDWQVVSAGPTTSSRMELFEDQFIKKFKISLIVGKGGMGNNTLQALQKYHAIYSAYTGGAGALAADRIKKVPTVFWLDELGMPEAVWIFEVESFGPLVVAMDAHGKSIYEKK
ncbi:MAG: FumA C-terminus/TtdB family hydratase beta subunit [Candidatus Thermoplasmatota archaeon]|nr:FumA C-terminus/TtdB family hydratase beta subunit [Candidatus Thermoplasmatota archaeon]